MIRKTEEGIWRKERDGRRFKENYYLGKIISLSSEGGRFYGNFLFVYVQ